MNELTLTGTYQELKAIYGVMERFSSDLQDVLSVLTTEELRAPLNQHIREINSALAHLNELLKMIEQDEIDRHGPIENLH